MEAAILVICAESLGALGLIFGFLTRLCALGIAAVMTDAIVMVHTQYGFFMNWQGTQAGEGFEFHPLAIGIALALMLKGGGALSIDRAISNRESQNRSNDDIAPQSGKPICCNNTSKYSSVGCFL